MNANEVVALAQVRTMVESGEARAIRMASTLSLARVAAAVGVSAVTVFRWEHAEHLPTGDAALRYLSLLLDLKALSTVESRAKAGAGARS
ncbi:MAG: helix-turn-helix domain-containing protein [Actinomycetota bacterium]